MADMASSSGSRLRRSCGSCWEVGRRSTEHSPGPGTKHRRMAEVRLRAGGCTDERTCCGRLGCLARGRVVGRDPAIAGCIHVAPLNHGSPGVNSFAGGGNRNDEAPQDAARARQSLRQPASPGPPGASLASCLRLCQYKSAISVPGPTHGSCAGQCGSVFSFAPRGRRSWSSLHWDSHWQRKHCLFPSTCGLTGQAAGSRTRAASWRCGKRISKQSMVGTPIPNRILEEDVYSTLKL